MDSQKRICRLCLKIQDSLDTFKAIGEDMKDILDKVLQKMDFAAIQYHMMCTYCAGTLKKCFDFKVKCINTREYIGPFFKKDTVKLDLVDVYISKNENGAGVLDVADVCGLCMSPLKTCSALPVDIEGDVALRQMIKRCIPELDMNIIKKPVICLPCRGSLGNYYNFLTNRLIVEEKIKKYCEGQDIDSNGGMNPSCLLQFGLTDITKNLDGCSTDFVKVENEFCEEMGNVDDTDISNGGDIFKFEQVFCKEENLIETEDKKCLLRVEEVEIKTDESDFNRFEDVMLPEPKVGEGDFKIHSVKYRDPLEVTMYTCDNCSYQSKDKRVLQRHLLKHMDLSELTMYKCDSCLFETKYKKNLDSHLLKHKDPSEITMYKCEFCSYQAKRKRNINRHLLKHKNPSEVIMHKCDSCSFQSKHKTNLNRHLLSHMDPSKVTMYKCDSCSYQANCKGNLKKHSLKHMDPSELVMYKCDMCLFETKHKKNLERHLLKHKDPSEVTMYKCEFCSYQKEDKGGLKKHLLKHKDPSEVTMYKCYSCEYQTKRKSHIKRHLLIHKAH